MSGIYIPMEMPKICGQCQLKTAIACTRWKRVRSPAIDKHRDCPLIPVPEHGRLIDENSKTFPTFHRKELNDYMRGWNACLRSVRQQPTIIPADKEGEG